MHSGSLSEGRVAEHDVYTPCTDGSIISGAGECRECRHTSDAHKRYDDEFLVNPKVA